MRFQNIIKITLALSLICNICPANIANTLYGRVSNEIGHIGIEWDCISTIVKVHKGSPAEQAGLQKHDKILEVDGMKPKGGNIEGPPESYVKLTVNRRLPDRTYVILTFRIQRIPKSQINTHD